MPYFSGMYDNSENTGDGLGWNGEGTISLLSLTCPVNIDIRFENLKKIWVNWGGGVMKVIILLKALVPGVTH